MSTPPFQITSLASCFAVLACSLAAVEVSADCAVPKPPTFTLTLPKVVNPPNPQGWDLPTVWGPLNGQVPASDSITVPNGRPIYALFVSGYRSNAYLDQVMAYSFARHLMGQGAYVHYAWWNNLLAPYMERPLHHAQSHPGSIADLIDFATASAAEQKATPGENYQFLADAKLFLAAIRANNPEAVIVLVGHSMGGHTVAQLANETDVLIDLVAPIDPVACRTYPWASLVFQGQPHFNWTRYRATREGFLGYRSMAWEWQGGLNWDCVPTGPWRQSWGEAAAGSTDLPCLGQVHVHGAPHMTFGSNIINLYHRWQVEASYPFDYQDTRLFNPAFPFPPGGSQFQSVVATQASGTDTGGWPQSTLPLQGCCPASNGVGWPSDGHGEIIGARGPVLSVTPLATRVKTSPQCGALCPGLDWPARTFSDGVWGNPNASARVAALKALESLPLAQSWPHQPYNPALCKVSSALISRFDTMNKPATADAGPDQVIACDGCSTASADLNGAGSVDPEGLALTFTWTGPFGSASGAVASMPLPVGISCLTLQVKDSVGHISLDSVQVTVVDAASPLMPFTSAAGTWKQSAGRWTGIAFDEFFPGVPGALGCLLPDPLMPAILPLPGGVITVRSTQNGAPVCTLIDGSTAPAVSDAQILFPAGRVELTFDPPIRAFYTYYGSLAAGHTATMTVYGEGGLLLGAITTPASTHSVLAAGQGFTSTTPVRRIECSTTEAGTALMGAFVGLKAGEPSLGTVEIASYAGPAGSTVQIDLAVAFEGSCLADLNGDGTVDAGDLGLLLSAWGFCDTCPADLNGNGEVDSGDIGLLLSEWGPCNQ